MRFFSPKLFLSDDLKTRNTVFDAPLIKALNGFHIILGEGDSQTAYVLARYIQLPANLFGQRNAFNIEPCHQRSGFGVVAGMQNSAVCFCCADCNVVLLF